MEHPIKRLRCNIETRAVRFETEPMRKSDLLDYLDDLRKAFDHAYTAALELPDWKAPALTFRRGQLIPR